MMSLIKFVTALQIHYVIELQIQHSVIALVSNIIALVPTFVCDYIAHKGTKERTNLFCGNCVYDLCKQ